MSFKEKLELKEDVEKKQANYMVCGMGVGILVGCVGMAIFAMFGQIACGGITICIGMFGGMLVGMAIPKKE